MFCSAAKNKVLVVSGLGVPSVGSALEKRSSKVKRLDLGSDAPKNQMTGSLAQDLAGSGFSVAMEAPRDPFMAAAKAGSHQLSQPVVSGLVYTPLDKLKTVHPSDLFTMAMRFKPAAEGVKPVGTVNRQQIVNALHRLSPDFKAVRGVLQGYMGSAFGLDQSPEVGLVARFPKDVAVNSEDKNAAKTLLNAQGQNNLLSGSNLMHVMACTDCFMAKKDFDATSPCVQCMSRHLQVFKGELSSGEPKTFRPLSGTNMAQCAADQFYQEPTEVQFECVTPGTFSNQSFNMADTPNEPDCWYYITDFPAGITKLDINMHSNRDIDTKLGPKGFRMKNGQMPTRCYVGYNCNTSRRCSASRDTHGAHVDMCINQGGMSFYFSGDDTSDPVWERVVCDRVTKPLSLWIKNYSRRSGWCTLSYTYASAPMCDKPNAHPGSTGASGCRSCSEKDGDCGPGRKAQCNGGTTFECVADADRYSLPTSLPQGYRGNMQCSDMTNADSCSGLSCDTENGYEGAPIYDNGDNNGDPFQVAGCVRLPRYQVPPVVIGTKGRMQCEKPWDFTTCGGLECDEDGQGYTGTVHYSPGQMDGSFFGVTGCQKMPRFKIPDPLPEGYENGRRWEGEEFRRPSCSKYWKPSTSCKGVHCAYGYTGNVSYATGERDGDDVVLGGCATCPSAVCPDLKAPCNYGYVKDAQGCDTCACKGPDKLSTCADDTDAGGAFCKYVCTNKQTNGQDHCKLYPPCDQCRACGCGQSS